MISGLGDGGGGTANSGGGGDRETGKGEREEIVKYSIKILYSGRYQKILGRYLAKPDSYHAFWFML